MAVNDIARVYAISLLEIGQNKNILPLLQEEMELISDIIKEDKDLRTFLDSPGFTKESKKELINKVFSGKFSEYFVNFLNVLIDNDRQSFIIDIYEAFKAQLDIVNNRQRVTVISHSTLDKAMSNKIVAELEKKLKKDVIITEKIDTKILGGIILKIGDLMIDGSLSKNLKNIRNNLLNSKVRSEMAYED